jgi:hypothetical protein
VDVTEQKQLNDAREAGIPWKKWGPYLSERQWGTVREDYSQDGNAWAYFTHDQSRSRAYRWGEDGLGGISDDEQRPTSLGRAERVSLGQGCVPPVRRLRRRRGRQPGEDRHEGCGPVYPRCARRWLGMTMTPKPVNASCPGKS